jgi:neurofibromin 1
MLQDSDILAAVLYRIYQREGGVYLLLYGLLEQEVRSTGTLGIGVPGKRADASAVENQSQLFRANSIVTRIITQHVRTSGFAYFRNLLLPTVEAISEVNSETEQEDIIRIVNDLLSRIVKIEDVPSSLRHAFHLVSTTTLNKFEASRHAVSSFFFLRVLCPALISPERFDIIVEDDRSRLLLLKLGKILLNIANVQAFGGKDPQLAVYNDLLEAKYQEIVDFLTELGASWPEPATSANSPDKELARSDAEVDEEFM